MVPYVATGIASIDKAIHQLAVLIRLPVESNSLFEPQNGKKAKPSKGSVLFGPPGTGKSTILNAVKEECNRYPDQVISYFDVDIDILLDGNTKDNLHKLFSAASLLKPSVIVLDEVDELLPSPPLISMEKTLMRILSGTRRLEGVHLLATTNKPETLGSFLTRPGRIENKIEVGLPRSPEERRLWLELITNGWRICRGHLKDVAGRSHGFSPAEMEAMCRNARVISAERVNPCLANHDTSTWKSVVTDVEVTVPDLDQALSEMKKLRGDPPDC